MRLKNYVQSSVTQRDSMWHKSCGRDKATDIDEPNELQLHKTHATNLYFSQYSSLTFCYIN